MNTDQNSLEGMLDREPAIEQAVAPVEHEAPKGDNNSAAPPAAASDQQPKAEDGPLVPRKALEDERRKRQDIERRLADLTRQPAQQTKQVEQPAVPNEPPDMFADPNGYTQWVMAQAMAAAERQTEFKLLNRELNRSETRARKAHGDEAVDAALEAVRQAGLQTKFLSEDDCYAAMIAWHQEYQVARDPAAHRERIRQELMAEMGMTQAGKQPAAAPAAKPRAPLPKSLASTTSAQPRDSSGRFAGPTPLEDILG
jgi:hypothetical protein